MGEIARSNKEITLFYNPDSIIGKKTLAFAVAEGLPLRNVNILKTPFTGTQLVELAASLHLKVSELVNKNNPNFQKHFGNPNLSDRDWIKILQKNPELLKEPIAIKGNITILVETPSDIIKL